MNRQRVSSPEGSFVREPGAPAESGTQSFRGRAGQDK
jgi:hypothetical protein